MKIMFGHVHVCVTDDALDGGQIHAQGLHLAHVSVAAAVRRQYPDAAHLLQSLLEIAAEGLGIDDLTGLPFPEVSTRRLALAELFREGHRVFADQVVGLGLVEDLEQHPPALGQAGIGASLPLQLFEEALNVQRLDAPERPVGEAFLEDAQGVLVVFLGGGRDVVLVLLVPEIRPFGESPELVRVQPLGLLLLVFAELCPDFFLRLSVKGSVLSVFALAVVPEAHHHGALPAAVVSLTESALPVGSSSLCQ